MQVLMENYCYKIFSYSFSTMTVLTATKSRKKKSQLLIYIYILLIDKVLHLSWLKCFSDQKNKHSVVNKLLTLYDHKN